MFESRLKKLAETCGEPMNPTIAECREEFANFYPCFAMYLRPSKKFDHGIDSLIEFGIITHIMSESPSDYWRTMAASEPWDEEFKHASDMLNLPCQ